VDWQSLTGNAPQLAMPDWQSPIGNACLHDKTLPAKNAVEIVPLLQIPSLRVNSVP